MIRRLEVFVPSNRVSRSGARLGFDGRNEMERQARGNRYAAAKRKAENEVWVARFVKSEMARTGWEARDALSTVELTFIEPNMRRDDDNVFAAAKFVLDALCKPSESGGRVVHANGCGAVLDDDPWHVCLITRRGKTDRLNPGVWIRITRSE